MKTAICALLATVGVVSAADWTYSDAGAIWVGDTYPECGMKSQSPLDLPVTGSKSNFKKSIEAPDLGWTAAYTGKFSKKAQTDKGYTWQTDLSGVGSLTLNDHDGATRTFDLAQFHYHTPSEHTFQEQYADMELHLVHVEKDVADQYGVLSISFKAQEDAEGDNPLLAPLLSGTKMNTSKASL